MRARQSRAFINFLTSLKLDLDGNMLWSVLDEEIPEISNFFTPNFRTSTLALHVKTVLEQGAQFESTTAVEPTSEIKLITSGSLRYLEPKTYALLQSIYLEGFALIYALEVDSSVSKLITAEDSTRIYENINYVCEVLADKEGYANTIFVLRQMIVDIMYIQSRLGGGTNAL